MRSDITEGVIWKTLLVFTAPILAGNLFQQLYNTADAVIVGKFVGDIALAAVGTATSLTNMLLGLFLGLSVGCGVVVAQFKGAGNVNGIDKAVHTSIAVALAGGLLLTAVGEIFAYRLLTLTNTPPDVIGEATLYLRVLFIGMVPSLVYNVGAGILRSLGDSRRPLYYLAASLCVNVVLALVFVGVFKMGVAGAALATALSQTLAAALVIANLMIVTDAWRLKIRKIRFHRAIAVRIFKIGMPAGVQLMLMSFSNVMVQSTVNTFGADAVAAWTTYVKIEGFVYLPLSAFGVSIATFVGQNLGAGKYERTKRGVFVCIGMAAAVTVICSSFILLFSKTLVSMFTSSPAVLEYGVMMLWYIIPLYFLYSFIEILSGALRGAGSAFAAMSAGMVGMSALRSLWSVVVMNGKFAMPVLFINYPVTWTVTSLALWIYFLRGGWLARFHSRRSADD